MRGLACEAPDQLAVLVLKEQCLLQIPLYGKHIPGITPSPKGRWREVVSKGL
jgi:hypothetical protein